MLIPTLVGGALCLILPNLISLIGFFDNSSVIDKKYYDDFVEDYKTFEDFAGKVVAAQATSLQQMYVEDQILALEK